MDTYLWCKRKTGLPLAIGSHLIPENKILRSKTESKWTVQVIM